MWVTHRDWNFRMSRRENTWEPIGLDKPQQVQEWHWKLLELVRNEICARTSTGSQSTTAYFVRPYRSQIPGTVIPQGSPPPGKWEWLPHYDISFTMITKWSFILFPTDYLNFILKVLPRIKLSCALLITSFYLKTFIFCAVDYLKFAPDFFSLSIHYLLTHFYLKKC